PNLFLIIIMSHEEHKTRAPKELAISVLTLSDTRGEAEDASGSLIKSKILEAGYSIARYAVIKEDPGKIEETLRLWLTDTVDAIITNGGTGLSHRDGTIEIAKKFFSKELPGFGELFRYLSFQQIGPACVLSRATAGIAQGKLLVCIPGSTNAVKLVLERILVPELPHMIWEIRR
ncbi:molybdenum cofactor biosynthesis protein MoaB, partial [bacterium]|nr:molybdenum cofactor biosynthesis protein MoaB [bacterium]